MAIIPAKNDGKWHYAIKRLICDTNDDIPNLPVDQVWVGSTAYVVENGDTYMFNSNKEWVKIQAGSMGGTGRAATIQVGQVVTGQPGSDVTITNSGTESAAIFDFSIPRGQPFQIKKVYTSIEDMNDDYNNPDIAVGDLVAIVSDPSDPDNASLYIKGDTIFEFFVDMSGATGIQGEPGAKGDKGDKGDTGNPFVYEDFTPEQLAGLKGDTGVGIDNITQAQDGTVTISLDDGSSYDIDTIQGIQGPQGDIGPAFTYSDFTEPQLEQLKGPEGDNGVGISSITSDANYVMTITLSNGDSYTIPLPPGADGADGQTAFYITKIYDTIANMEADLTQPEGTLAFVEEDDGVYIFNGTIWISLGSLTGSTGVQGPAGTITIGTVTSGQTASVTNVGTASNAILNFVLPKGDKGDKGDDGDDAPIVISAAVNEFGQLTFTYSDESKVTTPQSVIGPQGPAGARGVAGAGIASVEDLGEGEIKITLTNGTYYTFNIATVAGPQGETGEKGDPFEYDDFTPAQLEALKGDKGDPFTWDDLTPEQKAALTGAQGQTGTQGPQGNAGTITIGSVTTGAVPSVTNVGTAQNAILDIVLPVGSAYNIFGIYPSLEDAEADIDNIPANAMIVLANDGATNGNVYIKNGNNLDYVSNLGSMSGIEGPAGPAGTAGKSVVGAELNANGTFTFTYSDGTTTTTANAIAPIGFNTKGEWAPGVAYANNSSGVDIVNYNGASYACVTSHTSSSGETPDTSNKWMLIASGAAGTISVGTVTTGPEVSITNSGTPQNAVLDFVLPTATINAANIPDTDTVTGNTKIVIDNGRGYVKKADIDTVADYIANDSPIDELDTEAQTLAAAINELNEKLTPEALADLLGLVIAQGRTITIGNLDVSWQNQDSEGVIYEGPTVLTDYSASIQVRVTGGTVYGNLVVSGNSSNLTITDTSTSNTRDAMVISGEGLALLPVPAASVMYDTRQFSIGPCYVGTGGISDFRIVTNPERTEIIQIHGWIYGTIGPKRVDNICLNRPFMYITTEEEIVGTDNDYLSVVNPQAGQTLVYNPESLKFENKFLVWTGTQAEYDLIDTPDPEVIYIIISGD